MDLNNQSTRLSDTFRVFSVIELHLSWLFVLSIRIFETKQGKLDSFTISKPNILGELYLSPANNNILLRISSEIHMPDSLN